jgi:PqqD family protein of HPr-rel-A system
VVIELIGDSWFAYSACSGETHLLNDSSAALLECLPAETARLPTEVFAELSVDTDMSVEELQASAEGCWDTLRDAGLIRYLPCS